MLGAREHLKQTSIRAEQDHGDDWQAHNQALQVAAETEDAALPGNTGHATVNSAEHAAKKYRNSRDRKAAEAEQEAAGRTDIAHLTTFLHQANRAVDKAEEAREAGDHSKAAFYDRSATLHFAAATQQKKAMEKKGLLQNGAGENGPGQAEDGNDGIQLAAVRNGDGADADSKGGGGGPPDKSGAPTPDDIQAARDAQWKALKDSGRITDPARVQTALNEAKAALVKARETHKDNPDALAARTREIVAAFVQATKGAVADRVTGRKLLTLIQSPAFTAYPDDNAGDDALKTLTGTTPTATAAAKKARDDETSWDRTSSDSSATRKAAAAAQGDVDENKKAFNKKFFANHGVDPAKLAEAVRTGAAEIRDAKTPEARQQARARLRARVRQLFLEGAARRKAMRAAGKLPQTVPLAFRKDRQKLWAAVSRFVDGSDILKPGDAVQALNRFHRVTPAPQQEIADTRFKEWRAAHPNATLGDEARAAFAIGRQTGALPTAFGDTLGDAAQSGDPDRALKAYATVARLTFGDPQAHRALPDWLKLRIKVWRKLRTQPGLTGPANRQKLAREIEIRAPHTRSTLGVIAKAIPHSIGTLINMPIQAQAAMDRGARQALAPLYKRANTIMADPNLTPAEKRKALTALVKQAGQASLKGMDALNVHTRLAHVLHFRNQINDVIAGRSAAINPPPELAGKVAQWVTRQLNKYLAISEQNESSAAYILTDLFGGSVLAFGKTIAKATVRAGMGAAKVARQTADRTKRSAIAVKEQTQTIKSSAALRQASREDEKFRRLGNLITDLKTSHRTSDVRVRNYAIKAIQDFKPWDFDKLTHKLEGKVDPEIISFLKNRQTKIDLQGKFGEKTVERHLDNIHKNLPDSHIRRNQKVRPDSDIPPPYSEVDFVTNRDLEEFALFFFRAERSNRGVGFEAKTGRSHSEKQFERFQKINEKGGKLANDEEFKIRKIHYLRISESSASVDDITSVIKAALEKQGRFKSEEIEKAVSIARQVYTIAKRNKRYQHVTYGTLVAIVLYFLYSD